MADVTSRLRPLDAITSRPGCCYLCRGTQNGPFIDTSVTVAFEGRIYICRACILQMVNQLDISVDVPYIMNEEEIQERVAAAHITGFAEGQNLTLEALRGYVANFEPPVAPVSDDAGVSDAPILASVEDSKGAEGSPTKSRGKRADSSVSDIEVGSTDSESGRSGVSGDSGSGESSSVGQFGI